MKYKILLTLILVFVGVFLLGGNKAKASIYDQAQNNSWTEGQNLGAYRFDFGTPLGLNSISIALTPKNTTCSTQFQAPNGWYLDILDYDGGIPQISNIEGNYASGYFTFTLPFTLTTSSGSLWLHYNAFIPCSVGSWEGWNYAGSNTDTTYWNKFYSVAMPLTGINTNPPSSTSTSYSITFENLKDNMRTTDFNSWQLPFSLLNVSLPKLYSVGVKYKQASSTSWQFEDLGNVESLTLSESYSATWDMNKTHNLVPGDYVAEAQLYADGKMPFSYTVYDPNEYHWPLLASSTLFHFTISTSSQWGVGMIPRDLDATTTAITQHCGETNFKVFDNDFGKGLCEVFVPDPQQIEQIVGAFMDDVGGRIPFSYLYEIKTIIDNAGAGTTSSLPTVAIQTSSTSSIPNLNIQLFSASTVSNATSRNGFSTLRTLAKYLLYIGFAMMAYHTAVRLGEKRNK